MKKEKISQLREKSPFELLKEVLPSCFDGEGNLLIEKVEELARREGVEISRESYGLEWLGKSYSRVVATEPPRVLLKEDPEWNGREENENSENALIKGDNLEVLKLLREAYRGKVKAIYIDPPYNTGEDNFTYRDDRKYTPEELSRLAGISLEEANRILKFLSTPSSSHSAWLTFMYPRLYAARDLLREDGAILVSIDDNEVAQLKLLMDEIFGEENFVAQFVWQKNFAPKNDNKFVSVSHEYVLLYAKNKASFKRRLLPRSREHDRNYKNPDNDPRGPWASGTMLATTFSEKGVFEIVSPTGKRHLPPEGRCWRFSKEKVEELIRDNRIWFGADGNGVPRIKRFLSEVAPGVVPQTWLDYRTAGSSQDGSNELKELFEGRVVFSFPKPTRLIKHLLRIVSSDDDLIVDFFAGSGTTADAVLQLNAEDGGNRKFVLVQLPEPLDPKKSKAAYEFFREMGIKNPTVFDLTRERIVRAARALPERKERELQKVQEELEKLRAKKPTRRNLEKVKELEEEARRLKEELERSREQARKGFKIFETEELPQVEEPELLFPDLELSSFRVNPQALLTTWKLVDGLPLHQKVERLEAKGYPYYRAGEVVYLVEGSPTPEQVAALLEELIQNPPAKVVANGHALISRAMREVDEGLKRLLKTELTVRYLK